MFYFEKLAWIILHLSCEWLVSACNVVLPCIGKLAVPCHHCFVDAQTVDPSVWSSTFGDSSSFECIVPAQPNLDSPLGPFSHIILTAKGLFIGASNNPRKYKYNPYGKFAHIFRATHVWNASPQCAFMYNPDNNLAYWYCYYIAVYMCCVRVCMRVYMCCVHVYVCVHVHVCNVHKSTCIAIIATMHT